MNTENLTELTPPAPETEQPEPAPKAPWHAPAPTLTRIDLKRTMIGSGVKIDGTGPTN